MFAQNNVGIGTLTPSPSAILELAAAEKGFLLPRTDTTTMNNSGNTLTDGLLIYQITDKTFYYYDISFPKWRALGQGLVYVAGQGILINGNVISGNYSAGIGVDITGSVISGNYMGGQGITVTGNTISSSYVEGIGVDITGNIISGDYTAGIGVAISGNVISGNYVGGQGITVAGNTISSTYTAGIGIDITGNVISGDYVAGSGVTIAGNVISATGDNDWLFNGNNIYNGNAGNVGIGIQNPTVSLQVGTTDALGIPSGNTGQRPANPPIGATRFNSDTGVLEFFNGTGWLHVNTPPIGATYIQWFEAGDPNTLYPNTTWVATDIVDGSFIRARGGFANVVNGGALTGITQTDLIEDHQHTASGTVSGSGNLSTSSDGNHSHNWGGWWSNDDSRDYLNGNGDGNGNTISDNAFWWGGNPATIPYSVGEYSNISTIIDGNGSHSHGGSTGQPNSDNGAWIPYDDNTADNNGSTSFSGDNSSQCGSGWNGQYVVGNFLGRFTNSCLGHTHSIASDGFHGHNIRMYSHRHWLKQRPTSTDGLHSHTIADHSHGLTVNVGNLVTGGGVETRPSNEAVVFWRRVN